MRSRFGWWVALAALVACDGGGSSGGGDSGIDAMADALVADAGAGGEGGDAGAAGQGGEGGDAGAGGEGGEGGQGGEGGIGGEGGQGGQGGIGGEGGVGGQGGEGGQAGEGGQGGEAPPPCGQIPLIDAQFQARGPDRWRLDGVGPLSASLQGSCGGAGAEAVVAFTAERAGLYTFSTHDPATRYDTVLYVRSDCLATDSELACNDDRGTPQSGLLVTLEAGQSVVLVVDAFGEPSGPFALTATRADRAVRPQVMDGMANITAQQEMAIRLIGQDPNADVVAMEVVALTAGQPLTEPLRVALDDAFGEVDFVGTTRVPVLAGADTLRVRAVDSTDAHSDPIDLILGPQVVLPLGEPCDPDRVQNTCENNALCIARCVAPSPPEIVDGEAWRNGAELTLVITGRDATRDTQAARLELRAANRSLGEYFIFPQDDLRGLAEFRFRTRAGFPLPPEAVSVRVTLEDATGLLSAPAELPIADLPVIAAGAACDADRIANACADGTACVGFARATCRTITAPTLEVAEIILNREVGSLGLRVAGLDPENDVLGVRLRLLDAGGRDLGPVPVRLRSQEQQDGRFALRASGLLPPEALDFATALVEVDDVQGLVSAPLEAQPGEAIPVALGEPCDPLGALDRCVGDSACDDIEVEPRCVEANRPNIEEAHVYFTPDTAQIGVRLVGTDPETNVAGMAIELLDAGGRSLDLGGEYTFDTLQQAEGAFVGVLSLPLRVVAPIGRARLRAIDATGLYSDVVEVAVELPPEVPLGSPCDRFRALDRCVEGTACADPEGQGRPVCIVARRPTLTEARVYFNRNTRAFGIELAGTDPDGDLGTGHAELLDANGQRIDFAGEFALLRLEVSGDTFTGDGRLIRYPAHLAPPQRARIRVTDRQGLTSEPIEVAVGFPPVRQEGEACDVLEIWGLCNLDLACVDDRCVPANPLCEPGVQTGVLNEHFAGDRFRVEGDNSGRRADSQGTCDFGRGGAEVWAFTAPAVPGCDAGRCLRRWVFTADPIGRTDPVLYARRLCGVLSSELACNDDVVEGNRASQIEVELEVRQTIYLFVDTFDGQAGFYVLTAAPAP